MGGYLGDIWWTSRALGRTVSRGSYNKTRKLKVFIVNMLLFDRTTSYLKLHVILIGGLHRDLQRKLTIGDPMTTTIAMSILRSAMNPISENVPAFEIPDD